MSVFGEPLVIVDIETTGVSYKNGRVIEVAALRIEDGAVVATFQTLLDPGMPLPAYISAMTGIRPADVHGAPRFADIAGQLSAILHGAVFVAHNVRFDYSFLKQEFARIGMQFSPRMLCTVRLSRALYPHHSRHSLQHIIERHNLVASARHRALADAEVLWQFLQLVSAEFTVEVLGAALQQQLKRQALPPRLDPAEIDALPIGPGVYIFEDADRTPIYIGKSVTVKKRVLSHFTADHKISKELKIAQHVHHVRAQATSGELEALLLESQLVKELQPLYNRQLRRLKKLTLLRASTTPAGYMAAAVADVEQIVPEAIGDVLGVFENRSHAKEMLEMLKKLCSLCPVLLGLEKSRSSCFGYQLGKCHGACVGEEQPETYNRRFLQAFASLRLKAWPYDGPVLIEEAAAEASSGVVVDQWCVVAHVTQQQFSDWVVRPLGKAFDIDTYRILKAFVSGKKPRINVRPLSGEQLQTLLST